MVSTESQLVAYEFGIKDALNAVDQKIKSIPDEIWTAFIQDFTAYVHQNDLSRIVSLKNRGCLSGGEYVSPSQRALFRIPYSIIDLQPGSHSLESGWAATNGDLQPSDGHVTKTRNTAGGTVAHYHVTEEIRPHAIDPAEVSPYYVDAMWAAQKDQSFWSTGMTTLSVMA